MKKDAGEPFSFDQRKGFDSYNFHYYRTNRPGNIHTLALGDYRINLGQGLLLHHGFAITKSANPLLVKRVAPTIQPYSGDRKSTRLNSSHVAISYAVFCLKKK